MTIVEFLIARLDEDEAAAEAASASPVKTRYASGADIGPAVSRLLLHDRFAPARVLAEVAAKRHLVKWCGEVLQRPDWSTATMVLLTLAAVYADHPDYDPAWRVA